ncbi:MAG: SpaA isopeptide-forming pilin-related protein [Defluviitaleaceae bacterium]|nr:SpaA isopeptide-forming pilin-related protein [Defluviitaleaceae bacterium]
MEQGGATNSQTIFIQRPAETYALNFTNEPYSGLIIQNLDGYNGDPLPGVRFRIDRINGTGNVLIGEHVTDANGRIELTGLLGSFNITQLDVPNGWEFDAQPIRIAHVNAGAPTLVTFHSPRMGSLEITLADEDGNPLSGGRFEVRRQNGRLVGEFVTPVSGMVSIPNLGSGWFTVEQLASPQGFVMTDTGRSVEVSTNTVARANFVNIQRPSLVIEKVDTDGVPLQGAEFEVRTLSGELIHRGTTNNGGAITIPQLDPGAYTITESRAPDGFVITEPSRAIQIVAGQTLTERFVNYRAPALVIEKVDQDGNPLQGAEFEVRRINGELVHRVVTNTGGMAIIDVLAPGAYEITETRAPEGFAIVEPSRAIQVVAGQTLTERFVNPRLATFVIQKLDGDTNEPLEGVLFEITTLAGERVRNPVNGSFEFVTDNAGMIRLPNLEAGSYVAVETRPLPGYMAAEPVPFVVSHDREYIITIRNFRYPDYTIRKIDGNTQEPLAGVQFEIAMYFASGRIGERLRNPQDGSFVWTTDRAGLIRIPNLEHGTYIATETRPLPGYQLADPVVFVVDDHQPTTITIRNYRYSEWNVLKIDGDTSQPLAGVVFEIAHHFGTGTTGERIRNPHNGSFEFVSDNAGIVRFGPLEPGSFVITETRPLPGYRAAEPVIINVTGREVDTRITIRNYRDAELTIRKINSITRAPLAGVVFEISRPDSTRLINPRTGFYDFVTDRNGLIFLPVIEDGRYYLRETRPLPGFVVEQEVIPFNIDASARQREHVLVVENTPAAGLLIVKIDAQTRMPLAGVEFEIRHADGRIVSGMPLDANQPGTPVNSLQMTANGNFITDSAGRINLNHLAPGVYHVRETRALDGYQLDDTLHVVTITAGQQTVLEVENAPLAGFRLLKIDAITREPIFGVEFMVFDANNHVVGVFYTDDRGLIDFSAILAPGRYTIRETRPAPGYSRDDVPRTVDFIAGRVVEIVWENIPIAGQIQIQKVSGDDNQHNGLPAGTPLAGAVFEIFEARTGNLVDRIASNDRGMAVSRPLPIGRYIAREVAAPAFYMLNPQEIPFEIEFEGQIVRTTFPNFSANMGVTIRKTGPQEVMQGHNIMYEIPVLRNDSTVPLADFFWRDILPTNAARVDRLVTGTFNHALRYRIIATTNRGNELVVADNLSTTSNNVVELRPVHLGLAADEYLTDFTVHFGQVPAGFTAIERPRIYMDVLSSNQAILPGGMMFANRVDVGGRVIGSTEWVIGNATIASTVFSSVQRLPQSGW